MYTLSVDIGGTFTDVVAFDEGTGRTAVGKALTTPSDLRQGVLAGLENTASELGLSLRGMLGEAKRFVHATTQSSNAIFAFAGAKTAVITTRGFGDTLTIMRATGRVAGLSVFERHHYRMTSKPRLLATSATSSRCPSAWTMRAGPWCRSTRRRSGRWRRSLQRAGLRGGRGRLPVLPQERCARAARCARSWQRRRPSSTCRSRARWRRCSANTSVAPRRCSMPMSVR